MNRQKYPKKTWEKSSLDSFLKSFFLFFLCFEKWVTHLTFLFLTLGGMLWYGRHRGAVSEWRGGETLLGLKMLLPSLPYDEGCMEFSIVSCTHEDSFILGFGASWFVKDYVHRIGRTARGPYGKGHVRNLKQQKVTGCFLLWHTIQVLWNLMVLWYIQHNICGTHFAKPLPRPP